MNPLKLYKILHKQYGPQGWWPITTLAGKRGFDERGYHKGDYSFPKTSQQVYEICCGAILTQAVGWTSVEKALINLKELDALNPNTLLKMDDWKLKKAINPVGYFNQKAKKLKEFTKFYLALNGRTPTRAELLSVWGIGKETADSILLYAKNQPVFVIDAYTIRIFSRLYNKEFDYDSLQKLFMDNLEKGHSLFNEYHALLVEHAKNACKIKPNCPACCLKKACKSFSP